MTKVIVVYVVTDDDAELPDVWQWLEDHLSGKIYESGSRTITDEKTLSMALGIIGDVAGEVINV